MVTDGAGTHGHGRPTRRLATLVVAAAVGTATVLPAAPAWSAPVRPAAADGEIVETGHGPLGPADRELLVRVRLAGLWEIPAGRLAAARGDAERVREVGRLIADEHVELDERVREVAATLGVALPDEPLADHVSYLDRMRERGGREFDLEFVQRLRQAHGAIYPLIAYVRSGTGNELIREFADTATAYVGRHMTYLESTGLVDWHHIPPPPEPAGRQSRFLAAAPGGVHPALVWVLLGVAVFAGTVATVRTVRPR